MSPEKSPLRPVFPRCALGAGIPEKPAQPGGGDLNAIVL